MKRLILGILLFLSLLSRGICQSDTKKQIDYFIGEYIRYKETKPYEKAVTMLNSAASKALWSEDQHPYVIMRYALLEYMEKYGIEYPAGDDEKTILYLIEDRYNRKRINTTYRTTIIYVRTELRRIKYINPIFIPAHLIEMANMLDNCPAYEKESKYAKYYELIPQRITKTEKEELYTIIKEKAKECDGEAWAYEGLRGFLNGKSQQYIDRCLQYADITNKPAADGLRYFIQDARNSGTPEETQMLFDNAIKGKSVLVTIMAADRIKGTNKDEAMNLLAAVEDSNYFSEYGGDLIKGVILEKTGNIADIQQASLLLQKCMNQCMFKPLRKKAKALYDEFQTRMALISLREQEEMIDPYDALPADYTALAAAYETLKGYEDKAIQFYRIAADMGDIRSICRVAIDDIYKGILENDKNKTVNAAKVILDNADSHFLPLIYNAACIILFGLDGNEPDHKKAEILYRKFKTNFENGTTGKSYVAQDFLGTVMTLPRLPDLDFYDSDRAIQRYNEGLKYEKAGKYLEAEDLYTSASSLGHPTGTIKAHRMENLRREIKKEKQSQDK